MNQVEHFRGVEMEVPMIKTLLTFIKGDEKKAILCDYMGDTNDTYGRIKFQNAILSRNPFGHIPDSEIHEKTDNNYIIKSYENGTVLDSVEAIVTVVLEFKGRTFELKETSYDETEY
ncbi:hypothetical protein [Bacillus thuringiensis]|uniref:hypothetical protein n=1 Tax=Bacillus thuringiensis TaxID=1428 RepID=UPI0021D69BFC|nr:hypothetical protein [Bacillus thuringiensis]MCU7667678.1 hypothetical protein [Bacillus thuringiensis]